MASFYEASTSGLNFDRFTDELFGESTKLRMKQTYWTAKQLLREKLGKREDEHMMAADSELDMQLQRFHRIQESTKALLDALGQMQREFVDLSRHEFELAEQLSDCQGEKEHLRRVLQMTANSHAFCSKERQKMLRPITELYHELDEFYERAVLDSEQTVDAIEKVRLEYRGSLLWMKKCSETLDPEARNSASNLEDFRNVQNVVKANKRRLDQLKEDVGRKVELLHQAREKLFQQSLADYKAGLTQFYESTAGEFAACAEQMAGLESYEIDVLKILNDPIGVALEQEKEERDNKSKGRGATKKKFTASHRAQQPASSSNNGRKRFESESNDESIIELEDVDVATEVSEPAMDRVRELLRFDDDDADQEGIAPGNRGTIQQRDEEEGAEEDLFQLADEGTDIQWMKPAQNTVGGGLNLLKHSNELAGLMGMFEGQQKPKKTQDERWEVEVKRQQRAAGPTTTTDLLSELNAELTSGQSSSSSNKQQQQDQKEMDLLGSPTHSESPLAIFDECRQHQQLDFEDILVLKDGGKEVFAGQVNTAEKQRSAEPQEVPKLAPPPQATTKNLVNNQQQKLTNNSVLLEEVDPNDEEELLGWPR